tara:strand:+ start:40940 stop:43957 length:3018 start_codon:yes stop_codon:yes gene_type:complete
MAIDKKLLGSISSFATALEHLVEELKNQDNAKEKKKGILSGIFGTSGLTKTMKRVEKGIKEIKKDTTQILKNQKELLKLDKGSKKEKNKTIVGESGDKSNITKIKDGVGTIILIAAAVLAIGLAFKIISPVDIVSVLALGLAITMLGYTLARLKETGVPTPIESLLIGLALLAFTTAIVATSWLLRLMAPVSPIQLLTFGAILGTFALLSFGIKNLIKSVKNIKPIQLLFLPLILIGISAAIVASSHILQYTKIIPKDILLNVLFMGMVMGSIALVMSIPLLILSKMGSKNVLAGAFMSILLLPALALGILLSSLILNGVMHVSPKKLMNILLMGLTLGLVALVMSVPLLIISKMGKNAIVGALLAVVILPALSLGILLSSIMLNMTMYVSPKKLMSVLLIGLTMGLVAIVMSLPILLLSKMGKNAIVGSLLSIIVLPSLALGIMLSSFFLNKTMSIPPEKLLNILLMGVTLGLIALIMTIPLLVMGKNSGAMLKGAFVAIIALPLISLGIMLSSHILSLGNYSNPIPLGWVISFSVAMLILAIPVFILGKMDPVTLAFGALGLVLIATAIMLSSWILSIANPKGFEVMADAFAYFLKVAGPPIVKFVKEILPVLAKGIGLMATAILPPLKAFINGVLPVLQKFIEGILKNLFPMIKEMFSFLKEIVRNIGGIFESIGTMISTASDIFPKIGKMFKLIGEGMAAPLKAIEGIIRSVGDVIKETVSGIITLSELDPKKLENIGVSLGILGKAMKGLLGGGIGSAISEGLGSLFRKVTNTELPITKLLKSISENGEGLDKVADSLERLPKIMNEISKNGEVVDKVANSLSILGGVMKGLSGGIIPDVSNWLSGLLGKDTSENPITKLLKSINENGEGVDKVANSLERLPKIMNEISKINMSNNSFESLINGIENLNEIEIDKDNMKEVLHVLTRINEMKDLSANVESVVKNRVEIEGLENITEPKNEELLEQLYIMNYQLAIISNNGTTISGQLNRLRDKDDFKGIS